MKSSSSEKCARKSLVDSIIRCNRKYASTALVNTRFVRLNRFYIEIPFWLNRKQVSHATPALLKKNSQCSDGLIHTSFIF
jgi:hypothetical protein